jgi:hypothetical protein
VQPRPRLLDLIHAVLGHGAVGEGGDVAQPHRGAAVGA